MPCKFVFLCFCPQAAEEQDEAALKAEAMQRAHKAATAEAEALPDDDDSAALTPSRGGKSSGPGASRGKSNGDEDTAPSPRASRNTTKAGVGKSKGSGNKGVPSPKVSLDKAGSTSKAGAGEGEDVHAVFASDAEPPFRAAAPDSDDEGAGDNVQHPKHISDRASRDGPTGTGSEGAEERPRVRPAIARSVSRKPIIDEADD